MHPGYSCTYWHCIIWKQTGHIEETELNKCLFGNRIYGSALNYWIPVKPGEEGFTIPLYLIINSGSDFQKCWAFKTALTMTEGCMCSVLLKCWPCIWVRKRRMTRALISSWTVVSTWQQWNSCIICWTKKIHMYLNHLMALLWCHFKYILSVFIIRRQNRWWRQP